MSRLTRREFLGRAGGAAAALAASGTGLLHRGCSTGGGFDLLIRDALVYDGSGGPPIAADVGIRGALIAAVGSPDAGKARRTIDAAGRALAPGFIDIHDHTDLGLLANPKAESAVRQGVTTLISGQCGSSPFPLSETSAVEAAEAALREYGVDLGWRDIAGFYTRLEENGMAVNYASFVGQGTIREAVMGQASREAAAGEIETMKRLVRESMAGGALGVSSGLEYTPGSWAPPEEIIELCRSAALSGGLYATHLRNETDRVLEAVDEAVRIARESGAKLQISHLKVGYAENWPKFDALVARVEAAARSGLDIACDRYPYTAWSTGLIQFFPLWSREGTTEEVVARLRSPEFQDRLRSEIAAAERKLGSWDRVLISEVSLEGNRHLEGQTVQAAAAAAGRDAYEFMRDLLVEERTRVQAVTFAMSEDNLKRLMAHPLVGIGADGSARAPYGILAKGKPHPRSYGTFARALGRYVREEKVVSLEEMIRKMTSLPAGRLGLENRGRIAAGAFADLVLFDPDRIADRATWAEPAQYAAGVEAVIVNGTVVVEGEEHTGRLPGKVLRKDIHGRVS